MGEDRGWKPRKKGGGERFKRQEMIIGRDGRVGSRSNSRRGDEWSLQAFASMPSTAIFLRARAEIKNLLCELASNAKIWGARASEHLFKFCKQIEQR